MDGPAHCCNLTDMKLVLVSKVEAVVNDTSTALLTLVVSCLCFNSEGNV